MPANTPAGAPDQDDVFNQNVEDYDAWYDVPAGARIFASELDAVRPLLKDVHHPWLEVGVGTGRFAAALGVDHGIDPAANALEIARERGIEVQVARAEDLPSPDASFGAVIFIVTLCFVDDPRRALDEARRVLHRDGRLIIGVLPAEGPWARHYAKLADEGNPYYQEAHFFTRQEILGTLAVAGFEVERIRTTLFWSPGEGPRDEPARDGDDPRAGFLALRARKA